MPTVEERLARLETIIGELPADNSPSAPIVWTTRNGKFEHRSGIINEIEDASELALRRRNINELWNAEQPGSPENTPSTVSLLYSQPFGKNGDFDTPGLPDNPNSSRTAQIAFKVKGIPDLYNRRGQLVFAVNPGNGGSLKDSATIDADGSWRYGDKPTKYVAFADGDVINNGDWRRLNDPMGLVIITNLTYGVSAAFIIAQRGRIMKLAGHEEMGIGPGDGALGIFLNYDWPSAQYQIINRYTEPVEVTWEFRGGLNMPV